MWMHAAAAIPAWMHTDEPAAAMRTDIRTAFSGLRGGLAARHTELRRVTGCSPGPPCQHGNQRRAAESDVRSCVPHTDQLNMHRCRAGAAWPAGRAHELVGLLAEEHPSVLEQARMVKANRPVSTTHAL